MIRGKWYQAAGLIEWDENLAPVLVDEAKRRLLYQKWYTELFCHVRNCELCQRIMRELTAFAASAEIQEVK